VFLDQDPPPTFMGKTLTTNKDLFRSPYNVRISASAVGAMLEAEDFGADEVTDLLMVNIKVLDNIGHHWGIEDERYLASMTELDAFIGSFLDSLEEQLGDDFVLILTSDHGFGPPMLRPSEGDDERRHLLSELRSAVDSRLGVPGALEDVQYLNAYLDMALLAEAGRSTADACAALLEEPWIADCLVKQEVDGTAGD
jgi:predicted AlkP superfamily pyrophosphatase or phosphodiesterase